MTHKGFENRSYASLRADLLRFARRLATPDNAEDLVQEAFLSVARRGAAVPRDEHGLPQTAYMCAVIRNAAVDRLRKRRQQNIAEGWDAPDERSPRRVQSSEILELKDRLAGALPSLPPRQWQAAVLTTLGGLTTEQAAASVGGSREAICGSRERAFRQLRERISLPTSA